MGLGVIMNMRNPNALCTVGMLSALLENGNHDYVDLISPFILASVPETVGSKIELAEVQKTIRDEFGFEDMPLDFIRGILQRHAKKNGYFRRKSGQYYVVSLYDKHGLIERQARMREKIEYVLSKMQDYFMERFANKQLSIDTLKEMLEDFFECCGFEMAKDVDNLQTVTANSYGKRVFWVARYVLSVIDSNGLEKDYLLETVKGFLVSKALYYFQHNNKISISSKLKNVTCYLDCSLVISCLGYSTEEREHEILELIHMIRKSGGKVCVFEHTVAEASSLLDRFARLPTNINSFQLDGLASKKYTTEILLAIASSVKENLNEKLSIDTIPNPSYSNVENYVGIQDENAIAEWLEDKRKKHYKNRILHRERFDYDAKSLSSIGMLRRGFHPERIEQCRAILVTQDPYLSQCMKTLCPKTFPPEIDFAILDIDLVSLLWLENYNKKSSLPVDILIANALALNIASPEIMDRAIELTEQLVEAGDISEEAALTIRSQPKMKKYLGEVTQNDITSLTHSSLQRALKQYVDDATVKVQEEFEAVTSSLQRELDTVKQENRRLKEEKRQRQREYINGITRTANHLAHVAELIVVIFSFMILALSTIFWGVKLFTDYSLPQGPTWNWIFIVLDFLSLLQIWDYLCNPNSVTKKLSHMLRDWAFTHYYSRKIPNIKKY